MLPLQPLVEQAAEVLTSLLTPEVLLSTGVLTALAGFLGRIAWAAGTAVLAWLNSWSLRKVQRHSVGLARAKLPFDSGLIRPRCLIVRYGTDRYIEHLASEREKDDGRLQNRTIEIPIKVQADGSTSFELRIPVHKRLGTQFKCFVDVTDQAQVNTVLNFLGGCPSIVSPDLSSSPLHRHRIYFLLRDFATVKSIDGHDNNMCYPE